MLKFTIATMSFLGFINGQEVFCPPGPCAVDANSTTAVIANKRVTDLIITCDGPNQCKADAPAPGLIVYSSANRTYILCKGEDSCVETNINLGVTPPLQLDIDFSGVRYEAQITCSEKQSCKSMNVVNEGKISNGLLIDTPDDPVGDFTAAFLDSTVECGVDTACKLECGSDIDTCKDAKCFGNCQCLGNACPLDVNIRPTPPTTLPPVTTLAPVPQPSLSPVSPTAPTVVPTQEPEIRNITVCDVNGCVLTPEENYDVVCGDGFTSCIIDCVGENVCANGVLIAADSASVTVNCDGINSCDKIELEISNPSSVVTINLNSENSARNSKIVVNNGATLVINAVGKESFANGELICDGNCNVICSGKDACKDTLYECLSISDLCGLNCDSDNNQCTNIINLGDSSCDTPICNIIPDGNTRVVAPNNVDVLTIDCTTRPQQCKDSGAGLKIFTAAKETIVKCNEQDGCEGIQICAGSLTGERVPRGFEESEFAINPLTGSISVTANCDFNSACKKLDLYAEGDVVVTVSGDGEDALQDSLAKCNSCGSLKYRCRDFNGCVNSNVFCTNVFDCDCESIFVDIGNDTAVLATTEAPRDSCPDINQYIAPRQKGIHAVNNMVKNTGKSSINVVVPILVIGAVLVFCVAIIMLNKNNNKKYKNIQGKNNSQQSYMLQNENIYSTYQVEMQ